MRQSGTAAAKPEPLTITVQRAKDLSGLGSTTIFALLKEGKLRSVKVEGRRLILFASLKALLGASVEA
jgi:hypothetical protein